MSAESVPSEPFGIPPLSQDAVEPFTLETFSQLLVFHNPASRGAEETPVVVKQLRQGREYHGLEVITGLETSPYLVENIDHLNSVVMPYAIVAIRAGDGGTSKMLAAMRAAGLQNPVLLLPGGTKNDIWSNAFANVYAKNPTAALLAASGCLARPILAELETEAGFAALDAYGYLSVGLSGKIAADVNSKQYRQSWIHHIPGGRFAAERAVTAWDFMRSPAFDASGDIGATREYVDIMATNADRMGGALHLASDLFTPGFRLVTARGRLSAMAITLSMAMNRPTGQAVSATEQLEIHLRSHKGQILQVDGEDSQFDEPATLRLSQAPTGVQLLTSR